MSWRDNYLVFTVHCLYSGDKREETSASGQISHGHILLCNSKFSWIYEIQNGNISIYNETQDNTNIIKMHPQGDINDGMKFRDNSR